MIVFLAKVLIAFACSGTTACCVLTNEGNQILLKSTVRILFEPATFRPYKGWADHLNLAHQGAGALQDSVTVPFGYSVSRHGCQAVLSVR